jgi:hypothetical protein
MNRDELELLLASEDFDPRSYSLIEEPKDEALCLRREGHGWCIYYSERGLETGKQFFSSENAACLCFLEKLRRDPTTKKGWKSGFSM